VCQRVETTSEAWHWLRAISRAIGLMRLDDRVQYSKNSSHQSCIVGENDWTQMA
jgi:hypothetical protein